MVWDYFIPWSSGQSHLGSKAVGYKSPEIPAIFQPRIVKNQQGILSQENSNLQCP